MKHELLLTFVTQYSVPPQTETQHHMQALLTGLCDRHGIHPIPKLLFYRDLNDTPSLNLAQKNTIIVSDTALDTITDPAERQAMLAYEITEMLQNGLNEQKRRGWTWLPREISEEDCVRMVAQLTGDVKPLHTMLHRFQENRPPSKMQLFVSRIDRHIEKLGASAPPMDGYLESLIALHRIQPDLAQFKSR